MGPNAGGGTIAPAEPPPTRCDIAIVGAGASGAAAAWRLSQAGFDVVCLEQGDHAARDRIPTEDEDWEWTRLGVWHPNPNVRGLATDYPVLADTSPIQPLMFNGVGGSTVMWSCHLPRFHPSDFRMASLDGVGDDWPVSYDELSPYYALNERMTGVAGLAGDPAYPSLPGRQTPPAPLGPGGERVAAAFDRLGWSWWPADLALNTVAHDGRGACNHCGPCELGCPRRAKSSADLTYWPKALRQGARLQTEARVTAIEVDDQDRTKAVIWRDGSGATHRLVASSVMLAANGVGTPRLLFLSATGRWPDGLANRSGLVGRRLMLHPLARIVGRFGEPVFGHRGIAAGVLVSHHFYETDPARGFARGIKLQLLRSHGPLMAALGSTLPRFDWGDGHHGRFEEVFDHTAGLSICVDDLPEVENRVVLDHGRTDSSGLPAARMIYRVGENSRRALDFGMARAREALTEAGAVELHDQPIIADAGFHLMGTARMGDDPETSVTDRWGECHDVRNLWVIDGSLFVTAAAVNPTHTLQALALRAADRLIATRRDIAA